MRQRRLTLPFLIVLASVGMAATEGERRPDEEVALGRVPRSLRDSAVVVGWNETATDIAYAEDQFQTFKGVRALSMMHLAMHDALNAAVPVYTSYAHLGRDDSANAIAAAAQAAHDVLLSQYPDQRTKLGGRLDHWLSRAPGGPQKTRGLALGREAAAATLSKRNGDGCDSQGTYAFREGVGEYQTTPSWNGFVLQPGFRYARPFGLRSPNQFRPPPPPAIGSAEYAAAYNEVKDHGRVDSKARTRDQAGYAIWWMEFSDGCMNRLARELVTRRQTHLWQAARLFALLNMSIFDAYVATWDSKYHYNHWRPYTAIRAAGGDGNPATDPDPTWEALRPAPPFPEYVSAHGAGCGASTEIFQRVFGNEVPFTMDSVTAPRDMPTRSFRNFRQAGEECADSRVRLGFHFRYATDAGILLGRTVGAYVTESQLTLRPEFRPRAGSPF